MSVSPTNTEGSHNSNWRASVQQSYRNTEVREISRILAALEPGASAASKLRLAMQFEDAVYKSATSLADYRKRLTKRLKKLQKNYQPTAATPPSGSTDSSTNQQQVLNELRQTYGESLLYILKHASKAIEEMRIKHGDDKANQLQQHTNGVKMWAADLGLLVDDDDKKPAMTAERLERLKTHLQRRTENIRQHVVKFAQADEFMAETLNKLQEEFQQKPRASKILAECTRRRYDHIMTRSHNNNDREKNKLDPQKLLSDSLAAMHAPVPVVRDDSQQALQQLNRMRAASSVLLAYMAVPDKATVPKQALMQAHRQVTKEGLGIVQQVMQKHRESIQEPAVTLEDAWMKPLVLPDDEVDKTTDSPSPSKKRPRLSTAVRSRVLLTARRKTPSNLLPALKRKRARLVRAGNNGSHLLLKFGEAFVMTIYLVPLLVTIRAASNEKDADDQEDTPHNDCATWTPLHHGLTDRDLTLWGATGKYETLGYLVQERLRDASAHATAVLRKCFVKAALATTDFETEILEATSLLEFLQLARTTYMPDWQDDDAV